jgi:Kef-type K+ transport system membrane component KefB
VVGALDVDEIAAFVFIDIAVIIAAARLMGALFRKIGQPPVVGEIIAGILLGPTLLGAFPGHLDQHLFPTEVRPFLKVVAQLGLIIFMFIVGLELDVKLIRGKERLAAIVSVSSITLPFVLGFALAAALHSSHETAAKGGSIDFLPFAVFIGASMSVTAFPVLARILTERGMYRTEVGALTLACAAVDDVLAWSLLAIAIAVVDATGILDFPRIIVLSALFVAGMFVFVRPILARVVERYKRVGRLTPDILAVLLIGLLVSSWLTAKIGIHQIFGAFLFGVIMPREGTADLFHEILERLENVSVLLLLPVFFIVTGLDANVRGIGLDGLWQLALILLVACVGKFVGAAAAARAQGLPERKAAAIGVLMNTRGLTELVILNVGLAKGVLDLQLFTLLVVMAVVTTVITEPALRIVYPDKLLKRDIEEAEKAALGVEDAFRVLVAVEDPGRAERLVDCGADLATAEEPAEVVLTRFMSVTDRLELGSGLGTELADMAGSMAALNELTTRAQARGVRCVAMSQFSNDIPHDLVAQAETVEADVVLLGWTDPYESPSPLLRTVLESTSSSDVAVLVPGVGEAPGAGRPVVVEVQGSASDGAAVEMAVRIARARGADVHLVDARSTRRVKRLTAVVGEIERTGVRALVDSDAELPGLVVRPIPDDWMARGRLVDHPNGAGGAPLLLARAKPALSPEDPVERVRRLIKSRK